ncbi:MAG: hypothetical protein H6581_15760 [Bacteroidia bacterium]|nr:hypothetical protein [Bacteroidia bacterium]
MKARISPKRSVRFSSSYSFSHSNIVAAAKLLSLCHKLSQIEAKFPVSGGFIAEDFSPISIAGFHEKGFPAKNIIAG